MKSLWLIAVIALLVCNASAGAAELPKETPEQRDRRMAWFREARFGMFIHWGLYALPAGEWNGRKIGGIGEWIMNSARIPVAEYEKLAGQFNPVKFDARTWVRIAKGAGMRYIVITSKHHDGFCLWDSKVSDYDVMDRTPFKRDILKELSDACRQEGIVMCWYHSIMDWHHPDAQSIGYPNYNGSPPNPNFPRYVEQYLKPQVRELLTNYGKIGIMWFDGEWIGDWKPEMGRDMYAFCRSIQPDLIVNNRVGKGRQGMSGMDAGEGAVGDYGTPEQEIPATGMPGVDWETCMTMNDTWGFKKDDHNWKSTTTIIRMLIDTSSKGGNFLLNVGPTAEGLIPEPSVQRLAETGKWMAVNSESIYGSRPSPFRKLAWGRCTQKPGRLYLHVFDWPKDGLLPVPMRGRVNKAYFLASRDQLLETIAGEQGLQIRLPAVAPDPHATVIVLEVEEPIEVLASRVRQGADGSVVLKAADADICGGARLEEKGGIPNIGYWTDATAYVEWDAQLARPGTFAVEVVYACDPPSAGSQYEVVIGPEKVAGRVEATKAWDDFVVARLGRVTLPQAGSVKIAVKPTSKARNAQGVMNLREVVLRPAE